MKFIRKQRNVYALLFIASICLAVWLGSTFMLEAVSIFGAVSLISLLLLVRQNPTVNLSSQLFSEMIGHGRKVYFGMTEPMIY